MHMASLIQQRTKVLLKNFLTGYLPFLPIGILAFVYLYYGNQGFIPSVSDWPFYLLVILITIALRWFIGLNGRWLDRIFSWKKKMGVRLILGWLVNLLSMVLISSITALIILSIHDSFSTSPVEYLNQYSEELIKLTIISTAAMLLYSVIDFSFSSFNAYTRGEIEQIEIKRKQLELQLEVLKSQLSPHYLFNSLNTISSLIYKDTNQAEEFIRRLARSYHYIISTNEKISVGLNEEIDFVKSYHYLLRVRFENNIDLQIKITEDIENTEIPPLTLQMLVENAVKHNSISRDNPLQIVIENTADGRLLIANSKSGEVDHKNSFKIGLENIKKRYKYLTKDAIEILDKENFKVLLPLIRSEEVKP